MIRWRQQNDDKADALARGSTDIECRDESLTIQGPAASSDINFLAKLYGFDGRKPMPVVPADPRYYGDFSDVPDLRTVLDRVRDANTRFYDLPADMRARFANDPAKMWTWVNDAGNFDEAVELGLLLAKQDVVVPVKAVVPAVPVVAPVTHS